jgi:hypothetical protein
MILKAEYIRTLQIACPHIEIISGISQFIFLHWIFFQFFLILDLPDITSLGLIDDPTEEKLLILGNSTYIIIIQYGYYILYTFFQMI